MCQTGFFDTSHEALRIFLLRGVADWNEWRPLHPDTTPNLRGANLSAAANDRLSLRGANLTKARLSRVDLVGMDLSEADLEGAELMNANLAGTNFSSANLRAVLLRGARLSDGLGDFLEEDLSGDATGAINSLISKVRFDGGHFSIVQQGSSTPHEALENPVVVGGLRSHAASFFNVSFDGADLRRTIITGAELQGSSFTRTQFGETVIDT
jgi:uncharacterized protein YjbI with pentapeptide repeats